MLLLSHQPNSSIPLTQVYNLSWQLMYLVNNI